MSESILRILRRWAPLFVVLAFGLGILLGLGLGWQVWPVRWYDTDPSDLRLEHQMTYVVLTADSYAITADAASATARLEELTDEDTSWEQVANLVERVAQAQESAGDAASALRVRQLAIATNLPAAAQEEYQAPQKAVTSSVSLLGMVLLGVAAIVVAAGVVGYILSRRNQLPIEAPIEPQRRAHVLPLSEDEGDSAYAELARTSGAADPFVAAAPSATATIASVPGPADPDQVEFEQEPEVEQEQADEPSAAPRKENVLRSPFGLGKRRLAVKPAEEAPVVQAALPGELGRFEAEYALGQDDFDCSFSIESAEGDFYGECGIGIADVLASDGSQKVDAFELWLFDKGDIRTVSKMLVSEFAHQDESLSGKLNTKGELVPAEKGLVVELETLSLRVKATIRECRYADDGPRPSAYFALLAVDLVVEKNEAA